MGHSTAEHDDDVWIAARDDARAQRERRDQITKRIFAISVDTIEQNVGAPVLEFAYRVFEIVAAVTALIIFFPLMLLQALAIRLDSPGKALFMQTRVGMSRPTRGRDLQLRHDLCPPTGADFEADCLYLVPQVFRFWKFRTMYVDARERFPNLYDYGRLDRDEFLRWHVKTFDDPRVTRIGIWLRRLTLDELPNFWCVLIGTMRLVGPRPELYEFLHLHSAKEMEKFCVKPGITGLAQINGRGLLTRGETIHWDLKYVRERSLKLDLQILFRTIWLVLTRRGAF